MKSVVFRVPGLGVSIADVKSFVFRVQGSLGVRVSDVIKESRLFRASYFTAFRPRTVQCKGHR